MDYFALEQKITNYRKTYEVKEIGNTYFGRKIFAVERNLSNDFATAILVASIHGRENITTDLLCEMIDNKLFENVTEFNLSFILMANPDGVELSENGLESAPKNMHKFLFEANDRSLDFCLWKANGNGVDLNNNFDANFGSNTTKTKPSSSGFVGEFAMSELETQALVCYAKQRNTFFTVSYHSKGEEIYYNFFQDEKNLSRDRLIAEKFEKSTGYIIKNVENVSSGGFKDYCVLKLKIPSITIEVGSDNLKHPIKKEHLKEIFLRNKFIANDIKFAYNVFNKFK